VTETRIVRIGNSRGIRVLRESKKPEKKIVQRQKILKNECSQRNNVEKLQNGGETLRVTKSNPKE
jgi:hypothetical protein